MNIRQAILASSTSDEAKVIINSHIHEKKCDYTSSYCSSLRHLVGPCLNALIDSAQGEDDYRGYPMWLGRYASWEGIINSLSWPSPIKKEMQLIREGKIPKTVGKQPWLLIYAIYKKRVDLIDKLIKLNVEVLPDAFRLLTYKPKLIPQLATRLLNITTITVPHLRYLLHRSLIAYSLPYLGEFRDVLVDNCPFDDLMVLHGYGMKTLTIPMYWLTNLGYALCAEIEHRISQA